jgi:hypothetical protein
MLVGLCATSASAQTSSVDWKFYGSAKLDGDVICFYDANSVSKQPAGLLRVWTKCLSQKELDQIDIEKDFDGKILEATAKKVAHHYVPPIALVENIDFDQSVVVTQYEQTADLGNIQPYIRVFEELDCSEKNCEN